MHSLFTFVSSRLSLALSTGVALTVVACAAPSDAPSDDDVSTPELAAPSVAPNTATGYEVKASGPDFCSDVGKACSVTTSSSCKNGAVVCDGSYQYCRLSSGAEHASYDLRSCPKVVGAVVR
ncbi:MAG: hypothetical protein JST00_06380 [Deltaproteobacteria bacterium]|nr:hypothetical protein [Deltaproteobacteria bacterium]